MHHPSFDASPIPYALTPKQSNPRSLEAAVAAAAAFLDSKQKVVAIAGFQLRAAKASRQFMELVEASGYPFANMAGERREQWMSRVAIRQAAALAVREPLSRAFCVRSQ